MALGRILGGVRRYDFFGAGNTWALQVRLPPKFHSCERDFNALPGVGSQERRPHRRQWHRGARRHTEALGAWRAPCVEYSFCLFCICIMQFIYYILICIFVSAFCATYSRIPLSCLARSSSRPGHRSQCRN
jgi:hypothetical protein